MAGYFLDTNAIIRHITRDSAEQAERCYELFTRLEVGAQTVVTSESVIAEAVHVLSSKVSYGLPREKVREYLAPIIALRGLKLPHRRSCLRALDIYATTNIDFVDALSVAHMERMKLDVVLSFDRDFDRIKTISRQEP